MMDSVRKPLFQREDESENALCSNDNDEVDGFGQLKDLVKIPNLKKQEQFGVSSCKDEVIHNLETQLKVKEDGIIATLSHHDMIHKWIEDHLWTIQLERRQKGIGAESSHDDL